MKRFIFHLFHTNAQTAFWHLGAEKKKLRPIIKTLFVLFGWE
jgi:hypothetical protein